MSLNPKTGASASKSSASVNCFAKGFVPIPRTDLDDELWLESRVWSRYEAWMYIRTLARAVPLGALKRGEFQIPERDLAERAGWDRLRVRRFLQYLTDRGKLQRIDTAVRGEAAIYRVAEMYPSSKPAPVVNPRGSAPRKAAKTPGCPANEPAHEPSKPAPVVDLSTVDEPASEPQNDPPLASPNKEEIRGNEERNKMGEGNKHVSNTQEAAPPENPATRSPVLSAALETEIVESLPPGLGGKPDAPTEEQRRRWAEKFYEIVPRKAYELKTPLSKDQIRVLRTLMNFESLPWPKPGSWLGTQLARPV